MSTSRRDLVLGTALAALSALPRGAAAGVFAPDRFAPAPPGHRRGPFLAHGEQPSWGSPETLAQASAAPTSTVPATPAPRSSSGGGRGPLPAAGQEWRLPDEVHLFDGTTLRPVHDRRNVLVLYWWAS